MYPTSTVSPSSHLPEGPLPRRREGRQTLIRHQFREDEESGPVPIRARWRYLSDLCWARRRGQRAAHTRTLSTLELAPRSPPHCLHSSRPPAAAAWTRDVLPWRNSDSTRRSSHSFARRGIDTPNKILGSPTARTDERDRGIGQSADLNLHADVASLRELQVNTRRTQTPTYTQPNQSFNIAWHTVRPCCA